MKAQDFVRATAAYHDELCPAAWTGTEMKPEVRVRLIEIAQLFVQYLEVPDFEVFDVVLTGSLANYNWTEFSDFDLHVVTDYRLLNADDVADAFYRAKKTIWNDRHDITIYGHEVELYVEDINEPPVSGGVFSVYNGEWVKAPNHQNPNINDTAIVRKVQELEDQIQRCIATADDPEDLKRLTEKLRNMRKAGLADGGEFSVENLAFKTLRNMGVIKALHDAYIEKQDDSMRLNEFAPSSGGSDGGDLHDRIMAAIAQETNMFDAFGEDLVDSTVSDMITMGMIDDGTDIYDAIDKVGQSLEGDEQLDEFADNDFDDRPKFIPWNDFIEGVKGIVGRDFTVTENVVKDTIKARFTPHDPMEFGPTMLYSYYERRAGRNKGAVSTRGSIQVGKFYPNTSGLGQRNFITGFNLLKGHPFERHFDLTPENISKIASIILGNTQGAYEMPQQKL